jgi:flagellin
MSVINTNVKALVAQESMRSNNLKLSSAMERLSTGLRINSAKDDAAGLAISNRMTAQVRGMAMATRNANDGISMAQTADGAYGQVTSMLQRMRELAVQAATGSVTSDDRASIQLEVDELKAEIQNVAEKTNFNGIKLLDGSSQAVKLQTGTNEGDTISVGFNSVQVKDIGSGDAPALTSVGGISTTFLAFSAGDLRINGVAVGRSMAQDDSASHGSRTTPGSALVIAASAIAKVAAINRVSDQSGVVARVNKNEVGGTIMASATTASGSVTINGIATQAFTLGGDNETNRQTVVNAVNAISGMTGVTAINTGDDRLGVRLVAEDGRNIKININTHTAATTGLDATGSYVGTYSLYSVNGGAITIDHEDGISQERFQSTGLEIGTFESGRAIVATTNRAQAASAAMVAFNGDTLKINDIAIAAARNTDDTATPTSPTGRNSFKSSSAISIAAAINRSSDLHGVTAKAAPNVLRGTAFTANGVTGNIILNNSVITVASLTGGLDGIIDAINEQQGATGVVASRFGNALELIAEDGRTITIGVDATLTAAAIGLTGLTIGGTTAAPNGFASSVILTSDKAFTISKGDERTAQTFETLGFREGTFGGSYTGMKVAEADVTTQANAGMTITAIDAAIQDVSSSQAKSGAFQNRLDAIVSVLGESSENASAARSRILDTDYATETTALAKAQIIQQAATAMLAQANQQQQSVLALLQ